MVYAWYYDKDSLILDKMPVPVPLLPRRPWLMYRSFCLQWASQFAGMALRAWQTAHITVPYGPFGMAMRAVLAGVSARVAMRWHTGRCAMRPVA